MTATPHHPLLLLSFYLSLIFTPSIYPLYTYSTFCLLNWFPASCLSPLFLPPSSRLSLDAAALRRPKFPFHPSSPLLSFYPSLYLTSLYLSRCSVYHLPATLSSSIPPPSCLFTLRSYQFLLSSRLRYPPLHLAVFSASPVCFLSFSIRLPVLLVWPASCHLSVSLSFSLSLSGQCELVSGLCGSQGWWDVKSEVCLYVCVPVTLSRGEWWERKIQKQSYMKRLQDSTGNIKPRPVKFQICTMSYLSWFQSF